MHWVMVLVLFNVQTNELVAHREQLYPTQKDCEAAGDDLTGNVQYPDKLKATYICMSDEIWFPPQAKQPKDKKILGIL